MPIDNLFPTILLFAYNISMIILVGASASGKTVTALKLEEKYGFKKAVTTTTREKRINEKDGVDYFFLTKEEFLNKIKDNGLVEYTIYNNNYYGCGVEQVADNKVIVVDPNGLKSFKDLNNDNIVAFLLVAPEEVRYLRMLNRKDTEENAKKRLINDKKEFTEDKLAPIDYIIDTSKISIDEVADKIYKLYKTR